MSCFPNRRLQSLFRISLSRLALLLSIIVTAEVLGDNGNVSAQEPIHNVAVSQLLRPSRIVVHTHLEITDRAFLLPLLQRLRSTLAPPLYHLDTDFDLTPFRRRWSKLNAGLLLGGLINSIAWERERASIHVVLIADDMRLPPARYNFAAATGSIDTEYHVIVVSLDRLQDIGLLSGTDHNPERTAVRALKMIAKNVARVAGFGSSELCLFSFPASLDQLDAMPESFCEPDLSVLVDAGIARRPQD